MASDYHGPKPQTKSDIFMAKKHLIKTYALNQEKIVDHENAKDDALDNGDQKSAAYNQSHLTSHQADNKKIETSMKTVNKLKPVSPGLAKFVGKKKLGASNIASMAMKGN
jgi:hypothetical protein